MLQVCVFVQSLLLLLLLLLLLGSCLPRLENCVMLWLGGLAGCVDGHVCFCLADPAARRLFADFCMLCLYVLCVLHSTSARHAGVCACVRVRVHMGVQVWVCGRMGVWLSLCVRVSVCSTAGFLGQVLMQGHPFAFMCV